MEKIKLIVDTASDITAEDAQRLNIELLPVAITHGDRIYAEAFDMKKEEFWKILEESEIQPTTCQITPDQLLSAFKKAHGDGYTHIIVVTINSTGSGMYNNCFLAKNLFVEEFGDALTFEIIDSHTYTYQYGRPCMIAAEMIQNGASFSETVAFIKDRLSRVEGYAPIFTLKFARRSGRISGAAAFVGEVMGFKPIMHIYDGGVQTNEKVRGDKNVLPRTIELVKKRAVSLSEQEIMLVFGDIDEKYKEEIRDAVKNELKPGSIFEGKLGCSITNNCGPLVFGILFYGEKRNYY